MAALRVACALALCLSASAVDLPNKIDGVKTTYEVRPLPPGVSLTDRLRRD